MRVAEVDGAPSSTGVTDLIFSNGTVSISGSTATVTSGGGAGAADVVNAAGKVYSYLTWR